MMMMMMFCATYRVVQKSDTPVLILR